MKTCRTCKYLAVQPDAAGRIRPLKDRHYQCRAPILIGEIERLLPFSVDPLDLQFPRQTMTPDIGTGCPLWEQRPVKKQKPRHKKRKVAA